MNSRRSDLSRPIIGHLSTFVAVAETCSFRRAAELVGRSQPAVTAQIHQLENLLGVALFTRTTRQVTPTMAGLELLERAKKLVAETDRLIRDFQSQASLKRGRVSVSVSPTVASGVLVQSLLLFEQRFAEIVVSIREDLAPDMFEAVQTGVVEIGIGPYSDVPDRLAFRPIFDQPFFLVVPQRHRLARRKSIRLAEIKDLPLLCPSRGTTARALIDNAARAKGFTVRPKYEALQIQTLASMASAGLGATIMPLTDRRILSALGLIALPFADARLARRVGVISRQDEVLSPAAQAFLRVLLLLPTESGDAGGTGLRRRTID